MPDECTIERRDALVNSASRMLSIAKKAEANPAQLNNFRIRYEDLDNIRANFEMVQAQYEVELKKSKEKDDSQITIREQFDDVVYSIKSIYRSLCPVDGQTVQHVPSFTNNVRLPRLSIPTFVGDIASWNNFADLFRTLVHNNPSLSSVEKHQYLKLNLTGEPLNLIKNLEVNSNNYQIAWNILEKRYDNKRLIATHHVENILSLPVITTPSLRSLKNLINVINENIAALQVLKLPVDSWSLLLAIIILKKLDYDTHRQWELTVTDRRAFPDFNELVNFLENQVSVLESLAGGNIKSSPAPHPGDNPRNLRTKSSSTFVTSFSSPACILCRDNHFAYQCTEFKKKSPSDRFSLAKQHHLCINCLHPTHNLNSCPSIRSCTTCHKRHHSLLHFTSKDMLSGSPPQTNRPSVNVKAETVSYDPSTVMLTSSTPRSTVLLGTALVEIEDAHGVNHTIRILLDCASQASFITESCMSRLGLSRRRLHTPILALGEVPLNHAHGITTCRIHPEGQASSYFVTTAIIVKNITGNMPITSFSRASFAHTENLKLADPHYNMSSPIDMLLGADLFPHVLLGGRVFGTPGSPAALETVFGWILMGETHASEISPVNSFHVSINSIDTPSLDTLLKQFWEIEEVALHSPPQNSEEVRCESIYRDTVHRDSSGRYTVALPFRCYPPELGDSYRGALACFQSLQRRLTANTQLQDDYTAFMLDYLKSGHMKLVESNHKNAYYIPHHCVCKPDSTTTKLRVVFNASKKTTLGTSLNDVLLTGPALQQDIVSILLRFRFHKYVMTADIRQMYRQINVKPEHRSYQRILWTFDSDQPPQAYELNTVTYGLNCAPYLAIRTLKNLAEDERNNYPVACRVLDQDTYVDDVITGCDNLEDAISLQQELLHLFKSGCFELRKWSSNDARVLATVPITHRQIDNAHLNLEPDATIKVLGLRWNPSSDSFSYKIQSLVRDCTKRTILSEVAKIFDPLGWLAPITMFAKRLIQFIWTLSLDWDIPPPSDIVSRWRLFQEQLPLLSQINIARHIMTDDKFDLVGFCDASELGYAAVIYSRSSIESSQPHIALLSAKTRVAPLKRISLPRLELCAAVLLARLFKSLLLVLSKNIRNIYAWSDSTITLAWLRASPHRWKTFVSNRVTEIQAIVPPSCWRHVKSSENPADCASRGMLPADLLRHSLWWVGPSWLKSPVNTWSSDCQETDGTDSFLEVMTEERKLTLLIKTDNSCELLNKYSSLVTLQRITAYCFRFYNRCRAKIEPKSQFLTPLDLNNALLVWIKIVQLNAFKSEMVLLRKNRSCSRYIQKLNPFFDDNDILRVGGRIRHSQISYNQMHPILLPGRNQLTQLIIDHYHRLWLHPGPQALLAILCQKYWIISARNVIRYRLSKCHECFRSNPQVVTPLMSDLPPNRVTQLKPFLVVGVDYGGPFTISYSRARGIKTQKAYLCLFVCFATKALHLELASSLSTDSFLAAFRRFISRRGRCNHVYSDCGTNFVGAKRYLTELLALTNSKPYNEVMSTALVREGIEWHFNPPSAPHFGGLWEAGIKSVKKHLIRVIGEQILTYEELNTVFIQVEAVLNSRPLCPLSSDPNDFTALTPGHFLIQESPVSLPDPDYTSININRLSRWQLLQQLQQHFWNRWHREYLNTLQQRSKWIEDVVPISQDTLVLIKDELTPPIRWKLGRVESVLPGSDGVIRVAKIRTSTGVLIRPVAKLCPLPVEPTTST